MRSRVLVFIGSLKQLPRLEWPTALDELVRSSDPVNLPLSVWVNKHLLVMSGKKDPVVPYKHGGSAAFVEKLKTSGVKVDVLLDEDAGHKTTVKMVNRMVDWLWSEVLHHGGASTL